MTPGLQLRDLGVDTNVFNAAAGPKSDLTATLAPRLDFAVTFARRALLTANVTAGLVYYKTFESERSVDPEVTTRGEVYARRVTLFVENRHLRSRQRPNFEIDARSRQLDSNSTAGFIVRLGTKVSAEAVGFSRRFRYDQDALFLGTSLADALNRWELGWRLALRHRLTSLTTLLIRTDTERARFDVSPDRNADVFRGTAGLEFGARALITGNAQVGLGRFVMEDGRIPTFVGVVAKVALAHSLRGTTSLGFNWNRDVNYSFERLYPYFVGNIVGGTVRRQIAGPVDGIVTAQRAHYGYRALVDGASVLTPRRDVIVSYAVDLGYRVGRDVRIGFVSTWWVRTSTDGLRGYRGVRAGLSLTYAL